MADREEVIKGLEKVWDAFNHMEHELYADYVYDALELLKKQKAVEPELVGVNTWACGECGALLGWEEFSQSGLELVKYKFCPECGRAVKWDD